MKKARYLWFRPRRWHQRDVSCSWIH